MSNPLHTLNTMAQKSLPLVSGGAPRLGLRDRLWLWLHDYCPKHLIQRDGFFDVTFCSECTKERSREHDAQIERIRSEAKKGGCK